MYNKQAKNVGSTVEDIVLPKKNKRDASSIQHARIGEILFYISIVILPMIQVALYYVYVNVDSVLLAFRQWNSVEGKFVWVGFDNFRRVIEEVKLDGGWLNISVIQSCISWVASKIFLPLDLLFAYYCYKKMPGWSFFKGMLYLPNVLSTMVLTLLVQYMFNNLIPEIALARFGVTIDPMLRSGILLWWGHSIVHNRYVKNSRVIIGICIFGRLWSYTRVSHNHVPFDFWYVCCESCWWSCCNFHGAGELVYIFWNRFVKSD